MKRITGAILTSLCFFSALAAELINVNGTSLEYEVKGDGDTIVLFDAGAVSGLAGWDSIWEELPPAITAIRFSRRGEGRSGTCTGQLSKADYVNDLKALLDSLNVHKPIVYVSHSLGGIIAREYASIFHGSVSGMLMIDPANPRDVDIIRKIDPVNGPQEIENIKKNDYEMGASRWCFLDVIWDKSPAPGLSDIGNIPIALIAGVRRIENPERIFDMDKARELWGQYQEEWVNQFPQGKSILTENSGHFIQDDEPKLVLEELKKLLERIDEVRQSKID